MKMLENTEEIVFDEELYEKNLKDHAKEWEELEKHMQDEYGGTNLKEVD